MGDQEAEFCIVGGGYAGLTAALRLIQAGRSVALVEARDRVGGRVHTERMPDGAWLDFGGTWLGDYNEHIRALAKEMEVGTYPTYDRGESICVTDDGAVHRYAGTVPMFDLIALANLGGAIMEFESMAAELPMGSPWDAPKAQEWDSQTMCYLAVFIRQCAVSDRARDAQDARQYALLRRPNRDLVAAVRDADPLAWEPQSVNGRKGRDPATSVRRRCPRGCQPNGRTNRFGSPPEFPRACNRAGCRRGHRHR
jgi:monoamine oxidase